MAYRNINISKTALIEKLKENRDKHIVDYKEAVNAYKLECKEQLDAQLEKLTKGELDIELKLTRPINREEKFKEWLEAFAWETKEDIELSQSEFNEYVLDKSLESTNAILLNSLYKEKFRSRGI